MAQRASPAGARSPPQVFSTPPSTAGHKRGRSPNDLLSPSDTPLTSRRRVQATSVLSPLSHSQLSVPEEAEEPQVPMPTPSIQSPLAREASLSHGLDEAPALSDDAANFAPIAGQVVGLLTNITQTLRRHRALLRRLSEDEAWKVWSSVGSALDGLNTTVHALSDSYSHVGGILCHFGDDLAKIERVCGPSLDPAPRPPSPRLPSPRRPSPRPPSPYQPSSPLHEDIRSPSVGGRSPSPMPDLSRLNSPALSPRQSTPRQSSPPGSPDLPPRLSLAERIEQDAPRSLAERLHPAPSAQEATDWSMEYDTAPEDDPFQPAHSALPSRATSPTRQASPPRLSLAQRLRSPGPASRPSSRAASPASAAPSRGRSRARSRDPVNPYKKPPPDWDKTVYVVFHHNRPPDDNRLAPGVLKTNVQTAFERSHDLKEYSVQSLVWSTTGNITIILNRPPSAAAIALIQSRMIALFPHIPRGSFVSRPYYHRTTLGFRRVPCVDAAFQPLSPREAAAALFKLDEWKKYAEDPNTDFRWGFSQPGDTARRLIVEFVDDDEQHSAGERLCSVPVVFQEGELRAFPEVMPSRKTVSLCNLCFQWGHLDRECSTVNHVCPRCGGNHKAEAHHIMAACCRDRPDKETVRCTCPPVCRNCGGKHYANDSVCEFFRHRHDEEWYRPRVPTIAARLSTAAPPSTSPANVPANAGAHRQSSRMVTNAKPAMARGGRRGGRSRVSRGRT